MRTLLIGMVLFAAGSVLIWFQTNGQFIWDSFKENPFIVALLGGVVISYISIMGTAYVVEYFDGLLWPGRFIAFGLGTVVFSVLTWLYMGEGISLKTGISLLLSLMLISIQIFWK